MSELHWAEVRVGLFVAIAGAVLFAGIVYVGLAGTPFANRQHIFALFDDVSGLAEGSPVEMGGVIVGEVSSLELPDVTNGRVRVKLAVTPAALERVGKSSVAYVDSHAIVGQRYVGLLPRKADEKPLGDGDEIATRQSRDIGTLFDEARASLQRINELLADVAGIVEPVRSAAESLDDRTGTLGRLLHDDALYAQLDRAARSLQAAADKVASGKGTLGTLVQDEKLAADVRAGLVAFSETAKGLREGRGVLGRLAVEGPDAKRLDEVLGNLAKVSSNLADAKGTLGALISDPTLLVKLNRLVGEMDGLVADVRRNPSRYIRLQAF